MDLLKQMMENRKMAGLTMQMEKTTISTRSESISKTKSEKEEIERGSRRFRRFIIENKPGKKDVKEHLQAIVDAECESSSEEE